MAHAQINITPFSGSETDNFNEFEQLITGAIGVAALAAAQQANFLQLHLKGDAFSPTKNTPANLLRQGIVYDNPAPAQNRYGSQQANQFNRASTAQNRNMRGMNYPFNQQKN